MAKRELISETSTHTEIQQCSSLKRHKRSQKDSEDPEETPGYSPLLALPAELRNRIYEFVAVLEHEIHINVETKLRHSRKRCYEEHKHSPAEPRFFRTCQQIRKEATEIYYGNNAFEIFNLLQLRLWLKRLGEQRRKLLKRIRIRSYYPYPYFPRLEVALKILGEAETDLAEAKVPLRRNVLYTGTHYRGTRDYLNEAAIVAKIDQKD